MNISRRIKTPVEPMLHLWAEQKLTIHWRDLMKLTLAVLTLILLSAPYVWAQSVVQKDLGFIQQNMSVGAQQIFSASGLITESQWRTYPNQSSYRPFAEYRSIKNLNPVDQSENLEIFRAETAFVVNTQSLGQILSQSSGLDLLRQIDSGFRHQSIDPRQANQYYQQRLMEDYQSAMEVMEMRRQRILNPLSESELARATQVLEQQMQINQRVNWCESVEGQCVLSRAVFEGSWAMLMQTISALPMDSIVDVPEHIEQMAEIILFDANQGAATHPVVAGIPYEADTVLLINGFMANALIQFSQIAFSVHPLANNQSLVVIQTTIGMERNDLDKVNTPFLSARTILMGQSIYNGDRGFAMGLPRLQESMARQFWQLAR
jgi:hypothetical protein